MTAHRRLALACDGTDTPLGMCQCWFSDDRVFTVAALRLLARRTGWRTRRKDRRTVDLCPRCAGTYDGKWLDCNGEHDAANRPISSQVPSP